MTGPFRTIRGELRESDLSNDLAECCETEHVCLPGVEGVLIDHLDEDSP